MHNKLKSVARLSSLVWLMPTHVMAAGFRKNTVHGYGEFKNSYTGSKTAEAMAKLTAQANGLLLVAVGIVIFITIIGAIFATARLGKIGSDRDRATAKKSLKEQLIVMALIGFTPAIFILIIRLIGSTF